MKACLIDQCGKCKTPGIICEVYAGPNTVSTSKVSVASGIYQITTKTLKLEKIRQSLDKVRKFATSDSAKGSAAAIGAAVINDKDVILTKVRLPGGATTNIAQIIQLGNDIYAKDLNGGIKTLVQLLCRPLSQEEENDIGDAMTDGKIDYSKLLSAIKDQSDDIAMGKDLHQRDVAIWDTYGLYIVVGSVTVIICTCCVCCLYMYVRMKDNRAVG
ncbi:hypothetical protein ABVT39_022798 [Epinephelus coioides]